MGLASDVASIGRGLARFGRGGTSGTDGGGVDGGGGGSGGGGGGGGAGGGGGEGGDGAAGSWADDMDCAVVQLGCPFFALDLRVPKEEATDQDLEKSKQRGGQYTHRFYRQFQEQHDALAYGRLQVYTCRAPAVRLTTGN